MKKIVKKVVLMFVMLLLIPACGSDNTDGSDWSTKPDLTAIYYSGDNCEPDGPNARIELRWNKTSRAVHYEVFEDGVLIADDITTTNYTVHGPFEPNGIYVYRVVPYMEDVTGFGYMYGPISNPVGFDTWEGRCCPAEGPYYCGNYYE
jgi:hypothetical protein